MKKALLSTMLGALLVGVASPGGAQTFFGQDLRWALDGTAGDNSYDARASFLSNLVGVGTENFESFDFGSVAPLQLTFPGAGTATLSNYGRIYDSPGAGRIATSGSKFWEVRTGSSGNQFAVLFSSSVAAFGVFGFDVGDFADQLTLGFYNNNVLVHSWSPTHGLGGETNGANDGNLNFFGYINATDLFDEVRFSSSGSSAGNPDYWGFDDLTIGSRDQVVPIGTVPEPATMTLLATGLAGMVAARRRRKNS